MSETSANPSPPDSAWRFGREPDSIYSFILRVGIDGSPGSAPTRPLFRLVDVSAGREWRFADYESAAECLALRVREITNEAHPG